MKWKIGIAGTCLCFFVLFFLSTLDAFNWSRGERVSLLVIGVATIWIISFLFFFKDKQRRNGHESHEQVIKTPTKKWEYLTTYFPQRINHYDPDEDWDEAVVEKELNWRGKNGWELVNAAYTPPSGTPPYEDESASALFKYGEWNFFFKREIKEEETEK